MTLSLQSIRTNIKAQMDLPVVPAIAGRVVKELTNPMSNAEDLAKIINHDQALMGRILRIANSPVYRRRYATTTTDAAIVRLGRGLVKDLVISLSTKSLFRKFDRFEEELWGHSIAVAIAAQYVAGLYKKMDPSEAFVRGLLHDVGKIVLTNSAPERCRKAAAAAIKNNKPFFVAEYEEFKFHHGTVGAVLMEVWGLSQPLIDTSLYHHHIEEWDRIDEDSLPLVSIVVLADQLVNHFGINVGSRETELHLAEPCLDLLGLDPGSVEELEPNIVGQFEDDKAIFFG